MTSPRSHSWQLLVVVGQLPIAGTKQIVISRNTCIDECMQCTHKVTAEVLRDTNGNSCNYMDYHSLGNHKTACGCFVAGQSPCARARTAVFSLYAHSVTQKFLLQLWYAACGGIQCYMPLLLR